MGNAQALIGAEFDQYRIVRLLGQGGMGAVYEGLDLTLNRPVAIKVLAEDINSNPNALKRFQRETRAVAAVSHPNIAQIYRVGTFGDLPYYAMEYVDGKSLEQMMVENGGRVTGPRCFNFMMQAVRGLKAAADHGIIHRDVKPGNLMVAKDGTVKLVDFGIAKMMNESETFRTATDIVMGTPSYMSPEQCKGLPLDFKSDMYSLGCTFFHALTGRVPFDGDTIYTIMSKQISMPVPSISSLVPNVPDRFCNIIYTMMEKGPSQRYQTYEYLLSVLEAARDGRGTGITAMAADDLPAAEQLAADRRGRRRLYLVACAIAVLFIVLIIHAAMRSPVTRESLKTPTMEGAVLDEFPRGRSSIGKALQEINQADREARKEAREAY